MLDLLYKICPKLLHCQKVTKLKCTQLQTKSCKYQRRISNTRSHLIVADVKDREATFKTKLEEFERFADLASSTALQVALSGAAKNHNILSKIQNQAEHVSYTRIHVHFYINVFMQYSVCGLSR